MVPRFCQDIGPEGAIADEDTIDLGDGLWLITRDVNIYRFSYEDLGVIEHVHLRRLCHCLEPEAPAALQIPKRSEAGGSRATLSGSPLKGAMREVLIR